MPLGYDFVITYCKTTDFCQANGLPRIIKNQCSSDEEINISSITVENDVCLVLSNSVRSTPDTVDDVRQETANDEMLSRAIQFVKSKWPKCVLERELLDLYRRRCSLSVVDPCLMIADWVMISFTLRERVLRQFHSCHRGISRMKSIARGYT